jgi:hypothetical protein
MPSLLHPTCKAAAATDLDQRDLDADMAAARAGQVHMAEHAALGRLGLDGVPMHGVPLALVVHVAHRARKHSG